MVKLVLGGAHLDANTCRMILPSTWERIMDSSLCVPENEDISPMNFPVTFNYRSLLTPLGGSTTHGRRITSHSTPAVSFIRPNSIVIETSTPSVGNSKPIFILCESNH